MRKHAEWMTILDDRILEFLSEQGPRQPSQITDGLAELGMEYNSKYVGRRCQELADDALLENLGNGIYTTTSKGEEYLDGELNLSRAV
ncbi:phage repressor protein [Halobacteria archaeon AArc-curdl1]|uniref:Phage repressor protein n=1 Tax=Natronosalvus hydrolyticus TaxID=2979988 RepID=A0AAP2Z657_9EURY|nr:phage repressor protein [Halobacteria archaeon AArc-curdl1]